MRGYLLDTHTYLWLIKGDPQIPESIRALVRDPDLPSWLSMASCWELAIKIGLGKLPGYTTLEDALDPKVIGPVVELLPIRREHTQRYSSLGTVDGHRDPFDRMLVAQAEVEHLTLLSADALLDAYGVRRIWH